MSSRAKILIASAASVAVLGGVGAGLAYAGPPTPTPTPGGSPSASPSQGPTKDRVHRRPLLRRALHGEVTLAGEQHRVIVFQRGKVTQISGTALAVRSEDGFAATYELPDDLRVRQDREDASISDVKVGAAVRVLATRQESGKENSALTARRIVLVG